MTVSEPCAEDSNWHSAGDSRAKASNTYSAAEEPADEKPGHTTSWPTRAWFDRGHKASPYTLPGGRPSPSRPWLAFLMMSTILFTQASDNCFDEKQEDDEQIQNENHSDLDILQ
jgi:hypothetical protein